MGVGTLLFLSDSSTFPPHDPAMEGCPWGGRFCRSDDSEKKLRGKFFYLRDKNFYLRRRKNYL